ncbi:hypothetical protein COCMIDRAFT_104944 [Bipolaris oryzae ATCC 44560]|uniref:Uncharacterized protein n=1 Tax=Bipolaris oryzae ATCC 44560 TaxID=930090 RepID=W6YWH4_COCMI|nr:uncharacterized protein COCMIDRAFT_104944 [Bipolaris oryzae ATCC 44560]EUC41910.1 hypothetical protein COCMIDRAFT_104944 [Bipolaris oryzae ATCC 44560]
MRLFAVNAFPSQYDDVYPSPNSLPKNFQKENKPVIPQKKHLNRVANHGTLTLLFISLQN